MNIFTEPRNTPTPADHGRHAVLCARVESLALPKHECSTSLRLMRPTDRFPSLRHIREDVLPANAATQVRLLPGTI
jgi:hypothetical protein